MPTGNYGPGYPAVQAQTVAPLSSAGSGGVSEVPVAQVEGAAFGTILIGGTAGGSGPTVTVTLGGHPVTYTYVSGDTSHTAAASHIAAAINADGTDSALVSATAVSGLITIESLSDGVDGMLSLSTSTTGGATATASGDELDLPGNVVVPNQTFAWSLPAGGSQTFYAGIPVTVDPATKTALKAAGLVA